MMLAHTCTLQLPLSSLAAAPAAVVTRPAGGQTAAKPAAKEDAIMTGLVRAADAASPHHLHYHDWVLIPLSSCAVLHAACSSSCNTCCATLPCLWPCTLPLNNAQERSCNTLTLHISSCGSAALWTQFACASWCCCHHLVMVTPFSSPLNCPLPPASQPPPCPITCSRHH